MELVGSPIVRTLACRRQIPERNRVILGMSGDIRHQRGAAQTNAGTVPVGPKSYCALVRFFGWSMYDARKEIPDEKKFTERSRNETFPTKGGWRREL
jgi:hypothetical protein